ncbi:MAG: DUF4366 domain-containing protein [Clostridia bacterium]|nr:DUF4366 domain-containing protein [Clostridia bacterium]
MRNKLKRLSCLLLVVLCMTSFSVTAFASDGGHYASNENGTETPPDSIDSITVSTENVDLPEKEENNPLTPDGNLTLIDDILQKEPYSSDEDELQEKQFITVQSKNGNYFYLVIDRSGDTENVYFMNLVDEADLMALIEELEGGEAEVVTCTCPDKCAVGAINTTCVICRTNMSECMGKEAVVTPEPDTEKEPEPDVDEPAPKQSNSSLLLLVLILAAAGGGAVYWFKFKKDKPKTSGDSDLDDYDYGQEDAEEETEIDDADLMAEAEEDKENN